MYLMGDEMNKKILILFLFTLIFLSGCSKESEIWNSVVNKEFSNLDIWAGSGLYFYEENDTNYCTLMIYGSGVYVGGHYTSEVEFLEDEQMVIVLPFEYANVYIGEDITDTQGMIRVELDYINEMIKINDYDFEIFDGIKYHNYIDDDIE